MKEKVDKLINELLELRKSVYGQPNSEETYLQLGRAISNLIRVKERL
ncbi:MAG: hypothetical protein ACK40V_07765 [Anaerolineales bacterium]